MNLAGCFGCRTVLPLSGGLLNQIVWHKESSAVGAQIKTQAITVCQILVSADIEAARVAMICEILK